MSKIIALVDGSIYSQSVCDHAAWIAVRKGSSVEVLHILGRNEAAQSNLSGNIGLGARSKLMEELADLDAQTARLAAKRGRAILEDAQTRLTDGGVKNVTTRLRNGDLVTELLAAEADADLVVIGKRGEAADFAKQHLGSNLERVVRACKKPILVTSRAFQKVERFMIAFDGGKSAIKAVDHIGKSKVFAGLKCVLLTVGDEKLAVKRSLEGAAAQLRTAGYDVEAIIAQGQPEAVICQRLRDDNIDVLVMGAYGHSRIRNLIIGSTTTSMVQSCQVPVLLFR